MKFPFPEFDEAAFKRRQQERDEDRIVRSRKDLFNPVNLGHWIDLCRMAKIPHVPADEIARVGVRDICSFDHSPPPASLAGFGERVTSEMAARGENWMLRWACCACAEVKERLSSGKHEWDQSLVTFFGIDDMRAFDLVSEFPEETIGVYARPWMKAKVIDSYPVEYRVFVTHNQIDGISNYYPQRDLPNDASTLFDITRCIQFTARLLHAQTKPLNVPQMEAHWDMSQNHWTADFIRLEDGGLLFIEGGPPHTPNGGAHPCCFMGRNPDGIAFGATGEARERMGLD